MRKICDLDGVAIFERTAEMPWSHQFGNRDQVNPRWFESCFTEPQQQFLERHRYTIRSHPKHSPTIELFIDESTLDETEWSMLYLLFR